MGGSGTSAGVVRPEIVPPIVMPWLASSGLITTRYTSPSRSSTQPPDVPGDPTLHVGSCSSSPVTTIFETFGLQHTVGTDDVEREHPVGELGVGQRVGDDVAVLPRDHRVGVTDQDRGFIGPGLLDRQVGGRVG